MSPGLERQVTGRLLILQLFPQASPWLEGCCLQTPLGRVALIAPIVESANAKETPVIEGVVVIVAPTPGVVDVTVASFLVSSKRLL